MKGKAKGFTLIELIVVMAIFSIVMFAATSMMQPVAKVMVLADVREAGAAQVSNISKYLECNLSTAEYINTANFVPDETERNKMVQNYVKNYYTGILSKETKIADVDHSYVELSEAKYGKGLVHVMVIDNTADGKISEYVYEASFKEGEAPVQVSYEEYAVNRATYDNYHYTITPCVKKYSPAEFHFTNFMTSPGDVENTSFTIEGYTVRHEGKSNEQRFDFSGTATIPLVNMLNRGASGRPSGSYYVLEEQEDGNYKVVDQSKVDSLHVSPATIATIEGETAYGNRTSETYPYDTGGMCFIYSFGAEMSTD